jgi:glucosyl-dolichyl phosphate glucuronosyltransferase
MISVIIPTRNRADTLQRTLHSLHKQGAITTFEVIVVDNGSTDSTSAVCESFKNKFLSFTYVYDAEPGLLTGRHVGAIRAQGEVLCFLDDDVEVNTGWLEAVTELFKNDSVQLATGPVSPLFETEPPEWLAHFWHKMPNGGRACAWLSLIDLGTKEQEIHPTLVWGLNFCIRRKALIALGGFHPDNIPLALQAYQGDGETGLTLKAHNQGYKAFYHPGISLNHIISSERLTEQYFKKRAFYQGVCNSFTSLRQLHISPFFEPVFVKPSALMRLRNFLSSVKNRFFPKPYHKMKKMLEEEEQRGFQFHQRMFKEDESVRNWVLKEDYWDYKLPV